jgi:hypothetical protein
MVFQEATGVVGFFCLFSKKHECEAVAKIRIIRLRHHVEGATHRNPYGIAQGKALLAPSEAFSLTMLAKASCRMMCKGISR